MARRLTFTKPAAHLLSLVSGVKEESIQNMYVYEREMSHPYPWYSNDSYGGITLPHGNTYETIYTNNLFDDDDHGKNIYDWLAIASHEVGHINHINASNKTADASYQNQIKASKLAHGRFSPQPKAQLRLQTYISTFIGSYIKSGGHDDSPLECQAEQGAVTFKNFYKFMNLKYGKNALEKLFNSKATDKEKVAKIDSYWKEYINNKKSK